MTKGSGDNIFEAMAYRKIKKQVKEGLLKGLRTVVAPGLSQDEIKVVVPDLIKMLRNACVDSIIEIERDAIKDMVEG